MKDERSAFICDNSSVVSLFQVFVCDYVSSMFLHNVLFCYLKGEFFLCVAFSVDWIEY